MNQILYTSNGKTSGPLPIKTVAKFFAISLIVLGVIFFGEGAYAQFSFNANNQNDMDTTVPEIAFAKDGNTGTISVSHNKGITRVKYHWNDEDEIIVSGKSEKEVVIDSLNIPSGISTLYVEALDDNGREAKTSYECKYDGIAIDLSVVDNSDMKIVASDVKGISYMTYKWNSDEEITVYPNQEGDISIETKTEIPSGLNTLYITAVNNENITLTKKQEIKGNKRPEISFYIMDTDLFVTIKDEEGVDKVIQQVNAGEEETFDGKGQKEFTYKYSVGEERILVTITAIDVEGVSQTRKGKNY